MSTPLEESIRVAAELREVLAELDRLSVLIYGKTARVNRDGEVIEPGVVGAEARYKRKRLEAHAASTVQHGRKWTADQHNTQADMAAFGEWAEWNALTAGLRVVKERAHSLRQVLSSLQTAARVEADLAR